MPLSNIVSFLIKIGETNFTNLIRSSSMQFTLNSFHFISYYFLIKQKFKTCIFSHQNRRNKLYKLHTFQFYAIYFEFFSFFLYFLIKQKFETFFSLVLLTITLLTPFPFLFSLPSIFSTS